MTGKVWPVSMSGLAAIGLLAACASQRAMQTAHVIPEHAVVGVQDAQLQPEFWIARESSARRLVLNTQAIAAQNARLQQLDPSVHDIEKLPATLAAADIKAWIGKLSERPDAPLFDDQGRELAGLNAR